MIKLPAAPAMTKLVEAIHPDAQNGVANAVVDQPGIGGSATSVVRRIEVLEAGLIARDSAAVRCWRRRSRGCRSRPSPKA